MREGRRVTDQLTPGRVVYGEVPRFGHQQAPTYGPPRVATPWSSPGALSVRSHDPVSPTASVPLTSWPRRVAAFVVDQAAGLAAAALLVAAYALAITDLIGGQPPGWGRPAAVMLVVASALVVVQLGWSLLNRWIRAGRTGQSLGKRLLGIRLLSEQTDGPVGVGNAFLRDLVHLLDALPGLGFLWPLWDPHRQTFADKLMRTVVVDAPRPKADRG